MRSRTPIRQRIRPLAAVFGLAVALSFSGQANAQQIAPNPNPAGNTIIVDSPGENRQVFNNQGTIENRDQLINWSTLYNHDPGRLFNWATLDNQAGGRISNGGTLDNAVGGTITNAGRIEHYGHLHNEGSITNQAGGDISNESHLFNWGSIENQAHGDLFNWSTLDNMRSGTIINAGTLGNSDQLNNWGRIENQASGSIINDGAFANWSSLNNWDRIDNQRGATITNGGAIINHTEGTLTNGGTIENQAEGTIANAGILDNRVGGTITNARTLDNWGWVINCGLVENQAGGTITNQVGGTIFNDGTFDSGSGTFSNSGRYQGTGTFIGTLDSGSGTIAPGNSAGAMTVDGDFVLSAGTLEIEIGGFEAGEYDVLDITGAASLLTGGTIELLFLGTYDITTDLSCGESLSLMFLEADGGITGWPSTVSYDFWGTPSGFAYDVYQQDNGLWFQATNTNMPGPDIETIPAPGAGLLTGLGAALVGWCRRRQSA